MRIPSADIFGPLEETNDENEEEKDSEEESEEEQEEEEDTSTSEEEEEADNDAPRPWSLSEKISAQRIFPRLWWKCRFQYSITCK